MRGSIRVLPVSYSIRNVEVIIQPTIIPNSVHQWSEVGKSEGGVCNWRFIQ